MKIKKNYVLRQVAESYVVLAMGEAAVDFTGMITLNEAGALLWKELEKGSNSEMLAERLTDEYEVEHSQALADVNGFLDKLRKAGCLEE